MSLSEDEWRKLQNQKGVPLADCVLPKKSPLGITHKGSITKEARQTTTISSIRSKLNR